MAVERIFDPHLVGNLIERAGHDVDCSDLVWDTSPEAQRIKFLASLARDPQQGFRPLLVADCEMIERIDALRGVAPNFDEVTGIILRAAKLSQATQTRFRFEPLLISGPAGVGKSTYIRFLSQAIGDSTDLVEHSMSCISTRGPIIGRTLEWRGSTYGLVARALIEGRSAQPIICIDEIEKGWERGDGVEDDPTTVFTTLLEPETARTFKDAYIGATTRADHVLWVCLGNDISGLSPVLKDRFLKFKIAPPTEQGRREIIRSVYRNVVGARGSAIDLCLDEAVVDTLSETSIPRHHRLIIEVALGYAVENGRFYLIPTDIRRARTHLGADERPRIGFVTNAVG